MLVATLRGLLDAGVWDDIDATAEAVGRRYAQWSVSPENVRAPGGACMYGCRNLRAGVPWREAGKPDAGGCGTAMRSMGYGLWFPGNPDAAALFAAEHALLTHKHPMAMASAAAVAAGVSIATGFVEPFDVATAMIDAAGRYDRQTKHMLLDAVEYAEDSSVSARAVTDRWSGWAGHEAVAASLFCFLRSPEDFRDAVSMAVTSQGDSDSLGAITGALVGAHCGFGALPLDLVNAVEHSEDLGDLSDEVSRVVNSSMN
jgi:ADP-ribosylglycohydrolase